MSSLHRLHAPGRLLVVPNVWDALSAKLVEAAGAEALATSSAALAWAQGHADGQRLPVHDLVRTVARIATIADAPLTVDLEQGYSADPQAVADLVAQLADHGVEGVNLEDAGQPPELLARKIAAVRRKVGGRVFVNARTCVVIRGRVAADQIAQEVTARAQVYTEAGADGLFVPRLSDGAVIGDIVKAIQLPLNVMLVPGLPEPAVLLRLGVQRLSVGPRLAELAYAAAGAAARALIERGETHSLIAASLDYAATNALMAR
jgi:2-methylisocitrate lyase-like PEP mutase family enzyme